MKARGFLSLFLCLALLVGAGCPALAAGGRYTDLPPTHWGVETAEKALEYGLMQGVGQGRFDPDGQVTQGQFATILLRMLEGDKKAAAGEDWYAPYMAAAVERGILLEGETAPNRAITRREMAVMLVRALGLEWLTATAARWDQPFSDTRGDGYVNLAYHIGLTNGSPSGGGFVFRPGNTAGRIEAAAMAVRFYERYTGRLSWLHGFYAFSSYDQIGLTDEMDGVSVGWGRMCVDDEKGPWVNTTRTGNNEWAVPAGAEEARVRFKAGNTPCNLCVFCYAGGTAKLPDGTGTNVLAAVISPAYRSRAVAALVAAAEGYDGLTVDFEGLGRSEWREDMTAFMTELRAALPAEKTLWMAVPPADWYAGYDYRALGEVCDKVILMAHDYQWTSVPPEYVGGPRTDTPTAPLNRVYTALCQLTDRETGLRDPGKLALAVSFGSCGLQVEEDGETLAAASLYSPGPQVLSARLKQPDAQVNWSEEFRQPFVLYHTEEGARYKVWYEDARSVTEKIELARLFGVNGLSLWRLGMVPQDAGAPYYDVWQAILAQR